MIKLTVKKLNKKTMQIEDIGTVQKWNNDDENYKSLGDWINLLTPKPKAVIQLVGLKNAVAIGKNSKKNDATSLGVHTIYGNNCYFNTNHINILTANFDNAGGGRVFVYPENIDCVIVSHVVRNIVVSTWLNNSDEYRVPNKVIQKND